MTPFLMKALVLCGLIFHSINDGYIFGQMSGMIDDMMRPKSELNFTEDEISWIASTTYFSTFVGSLLSGFVTDMIGRKHAATFLTIPILLSWIILYYAQGVTVFILTRVIVGLFFGGAFITFTIAAAEYTPPKFRNILMSIISAVSPVIGTGIGHVLGTIMNWRYVALIGIIPTMFAVILPLSWVESPSWLASKGRFDECKKAFRALHGTGTVSEKELALLIKVETSKKNKNEINRTKFLDAIKQRRFVNVLIISSFVSIFFAVSGRAFLPLYAITIIKEITNSSDVVLFTLLLDFFTMIGTILSILFTKMFNMRPLLLVGGFLSSVCLLLLSASLYFRPGDISYMSWVNVSLLTLYFVITNAGPYPVLFGIISEIFPLDLKHYCVPICVSTSSLLCFVSVKMTIWLFSLWGYHGTFLFYMIMTLFCLFLFWWKLPETKGRTLQEIELYFQNNTFVDIDDLLSDQNNPLKA